MARNLLFFFKVAVLELSAELTVCGHKSAIGGLSMKSFSHILQTNVISLSFGILQISSECSECLSGRQICIGKHSIKLDIESLQKRLLGTMCWASMM